MDFIKVAVMGLEEAKTLQKDALEQSVEVILNHNDKTCTRGCSVTVEVHAKEADIPIISKIYQTKYMKMLEGLDVDLEALDAVFDSSAKEAVCPACATKFTPSSSECPECGLVLG